MKFHCGFTDVSNFIHALNSLGRIDEVICTILHIDTREYDSMTTGRY